MIKLQNIFIIFTTTLLISPSIKSQKPTTCNRSCPGGQLDPLPYPFGFSSGCEIQLNCTSNGSVLINEFPVQEVHSDGLLVSLPAMCGRQVHALAHLYGEHYAPTSTNAILMENCTEQMKNCMIPATMLRTHLEIVNCSDGEVGYGNVSCYSSDISQMFLDYTNVTKMGCRYLLTGVATEKIGDSPAVSLNIQMVKLGWWLKGTCDCASDADCISIVSPVDASNGYRCKCRTDFEGDGYKASSGCRKLQDSSGCNASKYFSGHCGGSGRVGVLVGAVVVGASLIICIGLIICFIRRRTISKSRSKISRQFYEAKGITIPIYTYKDIEKATNNFSEKQRLGTGAYGTVYSGKLHNGEWVAIKRIKHRSDGDENIDQVMNEIKLLSSVSHPNLVRLLGCSVDKDEQILVYEFMPNGTLSQHLRKERGNGLPWPVRLTIASETAQAIAYLHSNLDPPIYHRDVKSSNILLDYSFKTKVADFGLSRLGIMESSHISTAPQGTPGYLDPEYHQNFHLSDKSDVYSFGVVLIEIISAFKALDFSRRQNEVNLAALAVDRIKKGCLDEIIDPSLEANKDAWTFSSINKVAEIAFRCLAFYSEMRPSMSEVAAELEQIRTSREENILLLLDVSNSSSLSTVDEKETCKEAKNDEFDNKRLFDSMDSANGRNIAPGFVEEQWLSETSSPSSNGLLGSSSRM
ncbi:wall-associated receptor kinase-like 14 [Rutidosis leptorrhynchoides]|uniref:wall-associated receptor kinase-like 14 n=1 Tax=Rutidosis leptorrhynchoides TaxID=125765 RepID=UPI003A9961E2